MKTALITGISGQDGAYLSQFLLHKGYRVVGGMRYGATWDDWRLRELGIHEHIETELFELLELGSVLRLIEKVQPDEVYNLAAISHVSPTFDQPTYAMEVNGLGAVRLLEAIRIVNPKIKFYQASSSEMFGMVEETPQNEDTRFHPRSPYAAAKVYAHHMTVNYREAHGIFACSGILFNHESPLRGETFVTRKIAIGLAQIVRGIKVDPILLGNMNAQRDWGFAGDYVTGMWRMLQQNKADDYVLATGTSTTVYGFAKMAARAVGMELKCPAISEQINKTIIDERSGKEIIRIDDTLKRPAEVNLLKGDPSKAFKVLGWHPTMDVNQLAKLMVEEELRRC